MHIETKVHNLIALEGLNLIKAVKQDFNQDYEWSSYADCIGDNRWGSFIQRSILLDRFTNKGTDTYKDFIETSPAKSEFE